MQTDTPIEAQVVPETAVAIRPTQEVGLFGAQEPAAVINKAEIVAQALKAVIVKQGLVSKIQGKEYPRCEAWTLLGTMLGVFPVLTWTKPVEGGWEARVEAKTRDGAVIGAAEAQCLRSERNWANRDDFALRSMAQTRATAKCLRMPLGFVMSLTGCEVTPAEEMVADHPQPKHQPGPQDHPAASAKPETHKPSAGHTLHAPTKANRKWMVDTLVEEGLYKEPGCREYFQKVEGRELLLSTETVADLPLPYVPNSHEEMKMLVTRIKAFLNGERAERAFKPHFESEVVNKNVKPAAESLPTGPIKDPLWWRDVFVTIPRKGMKKVEYLKNPDTLGALFDARHKQDEESAYMRQRLWGLEKGAREVNWIPQPRTDPATGKTYQPSDGDKKLYEALRAFSEWFADNHRGERI